jgi:hypothetical protein
MGRVVEQTMEGCARWHAPNPSAPSTSRFPSGAEVPLIIAEPGTPLLQSAQYGARM